MTRRGNPCKPSNYLEMVDGDYACLSICCEKQCRAGNDELVAEDYSELIQCFVPQFRQRRRMFDGLPTPRQEALVEIASRVTACAVLEYETYPCDNQVRICDGQEGEENLFLPVSKNSVRLSEAADILPHSQRYHCRSDLYRKSLGRSNNHDRSHQLSNILNIPDG